MCQHSELARALYNQGKTDKQIAEAIGVNYNTVRKWRHQNGLPTKYPRRRRKGGAPDGSDRESAQCRG